MSLEHKTEGVDLLGLEDHLSEALDEADDEQTKYHLREAYQKVIILESEQ